MTCPISRQCSSRMTTSRIQPIGIGASHCAARKITMAAVISSVRPAPATAVRKADVGDLRDPVGARRDRDQRDERNRRFRGEDDRWGQDVGRDADRPERDLEDDEPGKPRGDCRREAGAAVARERVLRPLADVHDALGDPARRPSMVGPPESRRHSLEPPAESARHRLGPDGASEKPDPQRQDPGVAAREQATQDARPGRCPGLASRSPTRRALPPSRRRRRGRRSRRGSPPGRSRRPSRRCRSRRRRPLRPSPRRTPRSRHRPGPRAAALWP